MKNDPQELEKLQRKSTPSAQTVTAEHTPTPWKLHDRWLFSSAGPLALASGYQDWVTAPGGSKYDEWQANAAYIVEAVNNHATLTTSLAAASARIGELESADKMISEIEKRFPDWKSHRDLVDCIDVTLHHLRRGL